MLSVCTEPKSGKNQGMTERNVCHYMSAH